MMSRDSCSFFVPPCSYAIVSKNVATGA